MDEAINKHAYETYGTNERLSKMLSELLTVLPRETLHDKTCVNMMVYKLSQCLKPREIPNAESIVEQVFRISSADIERDPLRHILLAIIRKTFELYIHTSSDNKARASSGALPYHSSSIFVPFTKEDQEAKQEDMEK